MCFQKFLLISAAAVCGSISAMWAQGTSTPTSFTTDYVFPPVGLGSTETASVTVVNTAKAQTTTSTGTMAPAPSCTGTISFASASGTIGTASSFTVGSDQFKTVTLPFTGAGLTGIRGEIQATVSLTTSTSMRTPCSLTISLETYDSTTGATHAVLTNSLAAAVPILPVPFEH